MSLSAFCFLFQHFLKGVLPWLNQYFTAAPASLLFTDYAEFMQQINNTCRAWIAETKSPLNERCRCFTFGDDQFDGLLQHGISLRQQFSPGQTAFPWANRIAFQFTGCNLLILPFF